MNASDTQIKNSLQEFVKGLTSDQMADIVKNAGNDNFFMYAFIIFALVMITGMVTIVWIFMRRDTKKDIRQTEQYKNLLDAQSAQYKGLLEGYTRMIDQNATTSSEFRKTIADIGDVLRNLTNTISKTEALNDAKEDKFDLVLHRVDAIKEEISRSNGAMHQAFREHEKTNNDSHAVIDKSLQLCKDELKRNSDWCQRTR